MHTYCLSVAGVRARLGIFSRGSSARANELLDSSPIKPPSLNFLIKSPTGNDGGGMSDDACLPEWDLRIQMLQALNHVITHLV